MQPSDGTRLGGGNSKRNKYSSSGGDHGREVVSARKLVAEMWRLTVSGAAAGGGGGTSSFVGGRRKRYREKCCWLLPDGSIPSKLQSSFMKANHKMEGAENCDIMLKLGGKRVQAMSIASVVQSEIKRAQFRIRGLEHDCQSYKKKLDEARSSRERRRSSKVQAVFDELRLEFKRERRVRKRLECLNSELINELQKARSSAERFKRKCEAEKKRRGATEEACDELVNRVAEDKASFDEVKMESIRIQEELEEERRMLQMAEVWREERVQMKLIDVKLAIEDKYCRMSSLIDELESFLRSGSGRSSFTLAELQKAEMIREAAKLIRIDGSEFSYEHPKSSDMYSILQEIREFEATRWEVAPVDKHNPVGDGSRIPSSCSTSDSTSSEPISEVCSLSAEKSPQNHMTGMNNGRNSRNIPPNHECNRRLSSSTMCSTVTASSDRKLGRLPDSSDHRVDEAANEHVELPRGIQKNSLKAKLLEARLESQKAQSSNGIQQAS